MTVSPFFIKFLAPPFYKNFKKQIIIFRLYDCITFFIKFLAPPFYKKVDVTFLQKGGRNLLYDWYVPRWREISKQIMDAAEAAERAAGKGRA